MSKDVNWDAENVDDLTDEEIKARVEEEMYENSLSAMEKMRRDNPTLNDAWEQIKTIRALTDSEEKALKGQPSWYRAFTEVADGAVTDNEALREAWNRYYLLKNLILGANSKS